MPGRKTMDLKKSPVLVLGARSDIGRAVAHKFAKLGYPIQLAARDVLRLDAEKTDIQLRYRVSVTLHEFDALAYDTHQNFVSSLPQLPGIAISAVGLMGMQTESEENALAAIHVMRSNFEGPANILGILANFFQIREEGTLVGISSVAGDRGRAKNYVYGSAKAGLTAYLSGLRNRMNKHNVHVVTILPGFVETKMTKGMDLPSILTAKPDEVAEAIAHAIVKKKDIVYVKRIWWPIMLIIRNIPEGIFKKLNL